MTSIPDPAPAPRDLPAVGVLGFGTMGVGITQVLATGGRTVTVLETDAARLADGRNRLRESLRAAVERGKLSEAESQDVLDSTVGTTDPRDLGGVDLVIESVTEDLDVKRSVLRSVADVVAGDVPIATNTSAFPVTELAAGLPRPERVVGLHFFNPAPVMPTVEVVPGLESDRALVDRLVAFVESLPGKVAVVVEDRPGFLLNALLLPYLNDVLQEYDDGLATAEDIDAALELGLGYRTGPMAMLDLIGLDVHLQATEALYVATRDARYAPPPLLRRLVAAGRLGDKNGKGLRTAEPPSSTPTPHDDRSTTK